MGGKVFGVRICGLCLKPCPQSSFYASQASATNTPNEVIMLESSNCMALESRSPEGLVGVVSDSATSTEMELTVSPWSASRLVFKELLYADA
mmetsp:Transcript_27209/g.42552  ORF Transcript_27209/g.42552 Transcript_27209/m.42552 type:complete len:92 (+) Transcript_27209:1206-1481(+)